MLNQFYRWLAKKLVLVYANELRQEFQALYSGPEAHPAPVPGAPEWERRDGTVRTSPGVEYLIFETEKPVVFRAYVDCSGLLAVDAALFVLSIRLREGDGFQPFLVYEFKGAPSPERIKRKIPKEVIFQIPEIRSPAGVKLTVEQTAGLARSLYHVLYCSYPDAV